MYSLGLAQFRLLTARLCNLNNLRQIADATGDATRAAALGNEIARTELRRDQGLNELLDRMVDPTACACGARGREPAGQHNASAYLLSPPRTLAAACQARGHDNRGEACPACTLQDVCKTSTAAGTTDA